VARTEGAEAMLAGDIRLSIPSDPACLTVVRALIERIARLIGFGDEQVDLIILAVDEACTSIIRHQYDGRCDQRIDITVVATDPGNRLEVVLRDYGQVRDPKCFAGRDLDEVRPGGLGVHIIQEVMDEVQYTSAPGGGMQLRLVKTAVQE